MNTDPAQVQQRQEFVDAALKGHARFPEKEWQDAAESYVKTGGEWFLYVFPCDYRKAPKEATYRILPGS